MATKKDLVGGWSLVHWKSIPIDQSKSSYFPFGEDAEGQVFYTAQGHFSLCLMKKKRTMFASNDPLAATKEEALTINREFFAYFGEFDFDGKHVIHKVKQCNFPNWINTDLVRYVSLDGNYLTLTTDHYLCDGIQVTAEVKWKRS